MFVLKVKRNNGYILFYKEKVCKISAKWESRKFLEHLRDIWLWVAIAIEKNEKREKSWKRALRWQFTVIKSNFTSIQINSTLPLTSRSTRRSNNYEHIHTHRHFASNTFIIGGAYLRARIQWQRVKYFFFPKLSLSALN